MIPELPEFTHKYTPLLSVQVRVVSFCRLSSCFDYTLQFVMKLVEVEQISDDCQEVASSPGSSIFSMHARNSK